MIICAFGSAFALPFIVAISLQIQRIKRRSGPLTWVQLIAGSLVMILFLLPLLVWGIGVGVEGKDLTCLDCLLSARRPHSGGVAVPVVVVGVGGAAVAVVGQRRLHPVDDPTTAPIPTVAFVSFWAGLLTAAHFLRERSGVLGASELDQQVYVTPLRPESPIWAVVPQRRGCATCAALGSSADMPVVAT